jgi:SAM-dependent methyltransferase
MPEPPRAGKPSRRAGRLRFELRYWMRRTPWDSGTTPPEVLEFLERTVPGRALDLGCGTGTNAIALARRGWQVTAVDFSSRAIAAAHRKAARAKVVVTFLRRDVTGLDDLEGTFDFALDLGCFHAIDPAARPRYGGTLKRLLRPGGTCMLYAFTDPSDGWPAEADVRRTFEPDFELARLERGDFNGRPSAWFTWIHR